MTGTDDPHASVQTLSAATRTREGRNRPETGQKAQSKLRRDLERGSEEFSTNLSRDIRMPLALLLGPLQDILHSPASALASNSRAVLEVAQHNALRLLKLADSLPAFSGANSSAEPVDLAAFTQELAGNFRSACDAAGLRLIVDCPALPVPAYLHKPTWEKIVLNLIANAFKSTAEGTIEVRLRAQDGAAQLVVTDSGDGIPASELPYVFDRAQCRSSATDNAGFGLAFVRELVQRHDGSIEVRSQPGRGSSFNVRLPLPQVPDSAPIPATAFAAEAMPGLPASEATSSSTVMNPRGRIVIAEDNADMRDYLGYSLQAAGFDVDTLPDGTAALASCQARLPDAVLSDVAMPGLDGFALIERLRADERTAVIPVLLLSGRVDEDSRIAGLAAGADDYLVKPLGRRELVARVDGAVRLARLRREMAQREQADLEALFSMAPDGVIVVGSNGKILTANEQARQLFGYSAREFLELQVETLMPQGQRAAHARHRENYGRAPTLRLMNPIQELRGVRKDGSEFSAEIGLGPLQFKNQACTIAIVRDISERKKLENERAEQEKRFRDLSRRLMEVQEAERRKLSTELHDRTSPGLAAIQINLNLLNNLLTTQGTEDVRALLEDTAGLLADTTRSIREISANLRPTVLDDGGLLPALAGYAQQFKHRTGITVQLQTQDATTVQTPAVQSNLFRIVQEALTNCAKHAKAKNVTIRLSTSDSGVALTIADDGVGFDCERRSASGLGLLTMRERAEFAGGSFSLESRPGQGTRIQVLI